jgi:hypothetical protein
MRRVTTGHASSIHRSSGSPWKLERTRHRATLPLAERPTISIDGSDKFPRFHPRFRRLGLAALILTIGCVPNTSNLYTFVEPLDGAVVVHADMAPGSDMGLSNGSEPSGSGDDGPAATDDATVAAATDAPNPVPIQTDAGLTEDLGAIGMTRELGGSDVGPAYLAPAQDAAPFDSSGPDIVSADAKPPEKGLVGHWTFDEGMGTKVADSSGNGMFGTLVNGPTWSKRCAPVKSSGTNGSCLHFNGTDQFVQMADMALANISGVISMTAWIKMDATGTGSLDHGMRNIIAHGYTENPDAEVTMRLGYDNYITGSWDGTEHQVSSPAAADVGIWSHLASVYDGTAWRLYRNGKLIAFRLDSLGAVPVSRPWCIGAASSGKERFFSGSIDDVRLYNRPLSANEIANLASGTDVGVAGGSVP